MATKTLTINKDAPVGTDGVNNYGAGNDAHLPIGLMPAWLGGAARAFLQFNLDWTNVAQITSAVLHLRSNNYHGGIGGSVAQYFDLVTGTWTEGTDGGDEVWGSNGGGVVYPGPAVDTTYRVAATIGGVNSTWYTVDITAILNRWAPSSVKQSGGAAGPGTANRGLRIIAQNEGSAAFRTGFSSQESAYDPYIVLTYSTNAAPNAPTPALPANGATVASQTPTIEFAHSDPDSDAPVSFDVQVDGTSGNGVEPDWSGLAASTTGNVSDLVNPIDWVVGSTLTRGNWYAWRARTADATNGVGAWSTTQYFYVAKLPTNAMSTPLNGHTAKLYYTAGTTPSNTPKFVLGWTYSCPDGHAQQSVVVHVYADNAGVQGAEVIGSPFNATQSGQTLNLSAFGGPAANTFYWIAIQATCSAGVAAALSTAVRTRARWARASYFHDMGATPPVSWVTPVVNSLLPTNSAIVMEYGATSGAATPPAAEPATWYAAMSSVPIPAGAAHVYIWWRATMFAWGSATPTAPTLNDVTLKWNATGKVPDFWTLDAGFSIDESIEVYGSQCLRVAATAATVLRAKQVITVLPNTDYILSGYLKQDGPSGCSFRVMEADGSALILGWFPTNTTFDWTRGSVAFNSGSRTAVQLQLVSSSGGVGNYGWFDAMKLEASKIVTPWTPGFVGEGASLDAGGVQVDAAAGAVARFRASSGGLRDVVELLSHGWRFGGDTEMYSPSAGRIQIDGPTGAGAALALNGAAGQNGALYLGSAGTLDVRALRNGAKVLQLDDGAAGVIETRLLGALRLGLTSIAGAAITEGQLKWDDSRRAIAAGDSVQARAITPVGFLPFAYPEGLAWGDTLAVNLALAVSGGAVAIPIRLTAAMLLESYSFFNGDVAGAHTLEARLYLDRLDNSNTVNEIAGGDATWASFTPAAKDLRTSGNVSGAPLLLGPGLYWLVIRNTSASVVADIGRTGAGTTLQGNFCQTKTLASALGSTLDLVLATWTKTSVVPGVRLNGRVFGQASVF